MDQKNINILYESEVVLDDYINYFEDANITDINKQYEEAEELKCLEHEDRCTEFEEINKDMLRNHRIVGIGNVGKWNGKKKAYHLPKSLTDLLYSCCRSESEIVVYIKNKDLVVTTHHHDGINTMIYYIANENDEYIDENLERDLCDYIYDNKNIDELMKHLKPLGQIITEYYTGLKITS